MYVCMYVFQDERLCTTEVTSSLLPLHSELPGVFGQVLYGECSMGVQLILACHQGHIGRKVRVLLARFFRHD